MDPSAAKALWGGLTSEQKAMAAITADWQTRRQPEDASDDAVQIQDASGDELALPSSAPPSPVHCTMTISEACAH